MTRERAEELRNVITAAMQGVSDETAVENINLFPEWSGNGGEYLKDMRVRFGGKLYRVLQAHVSQEDWSPVVAPSLFSEVLPGQDGTELGEWIQPDSTNPYMTGDKVTFNGVVYESTIDGNVWSPADYPAGWKLVE